MLSGEAMKENSVRERGEKAVNLINCSSDCAYQKDGYCCLDFVPEISSVAVEGCHYYKKSEDKTDRAETENSFSDEKNN